MGKGKKKRGGQRKKVETREERKKKDEKRKAIFQKRRNKKRKVYNSTTFKRAKTKRTASVPKVSKKFENVVLNQNRYGKFEILKYPIATDAVSKTIDENNTIVFVVERTAKKGQIKKAFEELEEVKVVKVRTTITPRGLKKAFIKLHPDESAMDVATKLNIW